MSRDPSKGRKTGLPPLKSGEFPALLSAAVLGFVLAPQLPAQNVDHTRIQFTNATASAGIHFKHFKGNQGTSINREEFGPGVCVADFDGDGWQDIYFVNGGE